MIPTVRLVLRRSIRLAVCLAALHAAAVAAALVALQGWPLALVAAGTLLSGISSVLVVLLAWPRAIRELELQADYALRWREGNHDWHTGMVAPGAFVSGWLVLMEIVPGTGPRRWLALGPDSADATGLWELRLRLKNRRPLGRPPHNHTAG